MKMVNKSLSLPADLLEYAQRAAAQRAREHGQPVNVSGYIRSLLNDERQKEQQARGPIPARDGPKRKTAGGQL